MPNATIRSFTSLSLFNVRLWSFVTLQVELAAHRLAMGLSINQPCWVVLNQTGFTPGSPDLINCLQASRVVHQEGFILVSSPNLINCLQTKASYLTLVDASAIPTMADYSPNIITLVQAGIGTSSSLENKTLVRHGQAVRRRVRGIQI